MCELKSRIFEIVQYEVNPRTGEQLITEKQIQDGIKYRTIKRYAYILHNKDIYTDDDFNKYKEKHDGKEPIWKIGDTKPNHYHIVIKIDCPKSVSTIASWFKVPANQVEVPKGRGAFLDKVQYLTHETAKQQALGKKLYTDDEVIANFNFRAELDKRELELAEYGKILDPKTKMKYDVRFKGKTLFQCQKEDDILYLDLEEDLKKLRREYLLHQDTPTTRLNYYICGTGGIGKGLMSRALARSLYPQYESDDEIFFCIGGDKKITFDGYDGQPVIIWNDVRAYELIYKLGGRGNVFDIFDTHPSSTQGRQNIKYGSIKLCNEVNIVNSVEDYVEFLDGLSGEYTTKDGEKILAEDKGQSYRRFPMILPLHKDDFDLLLNKGFMNDTNEFEEYVAYQHIRGNMQKIAIACANNEKLAREIEAKTLSLPVSKHFELLEKEQNKELAEEEIRKMFEDVGTQDINKIPFTSYHAEKVNNHETLIDKDGYASSLATPRLSKQSIPSLDTKNSLEEIDVDKAIQDFIDGKSDELPF